MRSFLSRLFLMLAIGVLVAPGVPAQFGNKKDQGPTLRDVQGVVSDESGKPAAGAIVQLTNTKTLQVISFITKDQGDYYFHGLSPDIDFQIFAEREGKISATRTLSSFDNRKQAIMNLKLDRDKKK
jgi:hypothetical protein